MRGVEESADAWVGSLRTAEDRATSPGKVALSLFSFVRLVDPWAENAIENGSGIPRRWYVAVMTRVFRAQRECFLCEPDPGLVYLREGSFFAMLGLGPLREGYSVIATLEHVPSMLDLDQHRAEELIDFTRLVRARHVMRGYEPGAITEHGRVATCVYAVTEAHEPHCLHAHRLLFPGEPEVDLRLVASQVESYPDPLAAFEHFEWAGQYLYSETPNGSCALARAPRRLPRQLLRRLVAHRLDDDEAADWQTRPGLAIVEAGRRRLAG